MALSPFVRPPTIHDVARVAKLSKSTVSNVIRNAVGVHPQTRERVQAAIAELGYQTNIVARQLVQQRTTVLGIVIGDLINPFHAEMAKLIEGFTASHGYQVMFCSTRTDEDVELIGIRSMLEHRVAGLLFLCCGNTAERARQLIAGRVPAVFVGCSAGWGDVVSVDDVGGGRAATTCLINEGHRRIWHFAGDTGTLLRPCDRRLGYRQAMERAGLPAVCFALDDAGENAVIDGETTPLEQILSGDDAPTAGVAVNDSCALQIIEAAERLGIAVPERLSVIGFDDASYARHARVGLTTIAQPKERLAQLAVDTLVRRLSGELAEGPSRQILDFHLIMRTSTASPCHQAQPLEPSRELVSV